MASLTYLVTGSKLAGVKGILGCVSLSPSRLVWTCSHGDYFKVTKSSKKESLHVYIEI